MSTSTALVRSADAVRADAPAEIAALGAIAGRGAAGGAQAIQSLHRAIAGRAFGGTGSTKSPARVLHDAISTGVYGAVRGGLRAGGYVAGVVAALRASGDAPSDTRGGAAVIAALNGAVGDRLAEESSPAEIAMTVRVDGRALPLYPSAVAAAFPGATADLVVFLHGLGENEHHWARAGHLLHGDARSTHGERLRRDLDMTPVYVRYNSGLPLAENGRRLSGLLDTLVASWPGPVRRIVLVGHSMGGLVARLAAGQPGARWRSRLTHLVCLGSPHLGAPLEQLAVWATRALRRVPETSPVADVIDIRSAGVRDLCHGLREQPLPPGVRSLAIGATLMADPDHRIGRWIGDLLVGWTSACGDDGTCEPLGFEEAIHLPGRNHFDLLNHPEAYAPLRAFLSVQPRRRLLPRRV